MTYTAWKRKSNGPQAAKTSELIFSVQGQIVNILDFVRHRSAATTQFYSSTREVAIGRTEYMSVAVLKRPY